jgi:hypothetical protein
MVSKGEETGYRISSHMLEDKEGKLQTHSSLSKTAKEGNNIKMNLQ